MENLDHIKKIKSRYEKKWLAYPAVVAVGIGKTSESRTGLIISLKEKDESLVSQIPKSIEGVPLELVVSGEIRAL